RHLHRGVVEENHGSLRRGGRPRTAQIVAPRGVYTETLAITETRSPPRESLESRPRARDPRSAEEFLRRATRTTFALRRRRRGILCARAQSGSPAVRRRP